MIFIRHSDIVSHCDYFIVQTQLRYIRLTGNIRKGLLG